MNNPLITVLMPAYNAENYIREAIQSVLCQTFEDFEMLVIDDGSSDRTKQIVDEFSDIRIKRISKAHEGISKTLNIGLYCSTGKYIARFDADDICFPERLQYQVNFLESHPDHSLTGCDAAYIQEDGEYLFQFKCMAHEHHEIIRKLYFYCPFIHSGVMFRKEDVIAAGGYPIHAHHFEDYLLWVKLAKKGKLHNIPKPLIKVRFNAKSLTIDEKWRGYKFRKLKSQIIHRGEVTEKEGAQLLEIIKGQNDEGLKQAAYHALCAKKLLADNYQPGEARRQILKAINFKPFRIDNYGLLIVSYLPEKFIKWLHNQSPNRL
jgi:hypothetical protein